MFEIISRTFGRASNNRSSEMRVEFTEGAIAALETFYYSFNQKDIYVFNSVWVDQDLIQLNNPVGGIMRGKRDISNLYANIFNSSADVWVDFSDIVMYSFQDCVIFAGRENGEFRKNGKTIDLKIRTTRVFAYIQGKWGQVHHHGSIDDSALLKTYQDAVKVNG